MLNEGDTKTVVGLAGTGYLAGLGRARLARELFRGGFRPRQSVQLREIAAKYQLDHESVLKAFAEFQPLGMVTLSGNLSASVRPLEIPLEARAQGILLVIRRSPSEEGIGLSAGPNRGGV